MSEVNEIVENQLKEYLKTLAPKAQETSTVPSLADLYKMLSAGGLGQGFNQGFNQGPAITPVGVLLPVMVDGTYGYMQFGPEAASPDGFAAATRWIQSNGIERAKSGGSRWGNNNRSNNWSYRPRSNWR